MKLRSPGTESLRWNLFFPNELHSLNSDAHRVIWFHNEPEIWQKLLRSLWWFLLLRFKGFKCEAAFGAFAREHLSSFKSGLYAPLSFTTTSPDPSQRLRCVLFFMALFYERSIFKQCCSKFHRHPAAFGSAVARVKNSSSSFPFILL